MPGTELRVNLMVLSRNMSETPHRTVGYYFDIGFATKTKTKTRGYKDYQMEPVCKRGFMIEQEPNVGGVEEEAKPGNCWR